MRVHEAQKGGSHMIYPTLLKSAAFTVLFAAFKILEDTAIGRYKSFIQSIADIAKVVLVLGHTACGAVPIVFLILAPSSVSFAMCRVFLIGKS
jgi:hypothetical protein